MSQNGRSERAALINGAVPETRGVRQGSCCSCAAQPIDETRVGWFRSSQRPSLVDEKLQDDSHPALLPSNCLYELVFEVSDKSGQGRKDYSQALEYYASGS